MAHVVKLTDGTTARTASLVYDAGSQADYRLRYIAQRRELGLVPAMHTPDASTDGPEPTSHSRNNRQWFLTLTVSSTSRDDQLNNLNTLGRIMADASAARIGTPLDGYYLEVQLNGATNWTRFACKVADFVDDGGLYGVTSVTALHASAPTADPIVVMVETEPIGEGDIETLQNYCKTPHFLEDTNADGLADDWTEIGAPTTTLDTDTYYVGGQSQKVVTDTAGDDGIAGATIAVTSGAVVIASVAIIKSSGDAVKMELLADSSGSIDSVTTATAADETRTGEDGNSWSIYHLSGVADLADTTVQPRVYRPTAGAAAATTYYVDRCYVDIDGGSISDTPLLTNGDFETYTGTQDGGADGTFSGWTLSGTGSGDIAEPTATIFGSGTNAVKMTRGNDGCLLFQNATVTPGSVYRLQLYCRGDGTADGRVNIYDYTNSADIMAVAATGVTGTSYTVKNYMFTAPADCVTARVYLYTNAAGSCYWDHVTLREVTVDSLPTAWSSCNHVIGGPADSEYGGLVNYIDYCDIPGDQPAYMEMATGSEAHVTYPTLWYLGSVASPEAPQYYGRQYSTAGAGTRKYDEIASVTTSWKLLGVIQNVNSVTAYSAKVHGDMVLLAALNDQHSASAIEIKARVYYGASALASNYYDTDSVTLSAYNNHWTLEALGPINLNPPEGMRNAYGATEGILVELYGKHASASASVYVDWLQLLPNPCIVEIEEPSSTANKAFDFYGLEGGDKDIVISTYSTALFASGLVLQIDYPLAQLPRLLPGRLNRVYVALKQQTGAGNYHTVTIGGSDSWGVITTRYKPRTATLLGTL